MPRLSITPFAVADIERCRRFLALKSPNASVRAMQAIRKSLLRLIDAPEVGRPSRLSGYRELIIEFGDTGYVARYAYDPERDVVSVIALWHQLEAGY